MNYTELRTAIIDYTENTGVDFAAHLDDFIRLAEERIVRSVDLPVLRKSSTTSFTADNRFLPTPTDFLAVYSFAVFNGDDYTYLLNKDVNFLREAYPDVTTGGLPKYYGLWDDNTFIVGPRPDSSYGAQLHYYYDPESIVTATTTWLGDNAENALLYGALFEGYTFMKGDQDLLETYANRFTEEIGKLRLLGEGRNRGDTYRSGSARLEAR